VFVNHMKKRLASGDGFKAKGIFLGFPSTQMVEMIGYNGFDAVILDNEHGLLSAEQVEHMVIAAELAGVTPLVRVVSGDAATILKAMDRGAHGVHVPQIETRRQAEEVVEAVKYPPFGRRGAAFSMRAARYGTVPVHEYLEHANEQSLIAIHLESEQAITNIDEILAVQGIDLIYIGPTDLSVSMGCGGRIDHPEVLKAIDHIQTAALRHNVKLGIHTKDSKGARARMHWGANYVGLTVTSLLNDAFHQYTQDVDASVDPNKGVEQR
jgi:4-hydroxy-2-oxoheptanedioate aldolase